MWSPVVCNKHPFRAMCCPVNMYCDRDISCIVIVTYHVLISVQLVSYVVSISCNVISLWVWHYTGNIRELFYILSLIGLQFIELSSNIKLKVVSIKKKTANC